VDFLFLSKLLPLFFYPLGFACFSLTIALIIWWKYPRFLPIPIILALLILLVSSNVWVSNFLVKSLEWQYRISPDSIDNAQAIVVLGGGIKPLIYPRPMIDLAEQGDRIIYGAKLYKMEKAPLILVSGGRIPWKDSLNERSEADDMASLLLMLGIPESAIVKEGESYNTYDNAVYSRKILTEKGINQIILVTSALHMPRSVKIFEKQGFEVIPAPTDFLVTERDFNNNDNWQNTLINLFPDSLYLRNTNLALKEYLGIVVYKLKGWI
jgi:uncharacterized SAM-binding protein YcdF (DUF218 family)